MASAALAGDSLRILKYEDMEDYDEIKDFIRDTVPVFRRGAEDEFRPDLKRAVFVDNIVSGVGPDRFDKLFKLIKKTAQIEGLQYEIADNDVFVPLNENNETIGYCFIGYRSQVEAINAVRLITGQSMGKNRVLTALLYSDIVNLPSLSDECPPLPPQEFTSPPNVRSWMTEAPEGSHAQSAFRDQIIARFRMGQDNYKADLSFLGGDGKAERAYDASIDEQKGPAWRVLASRKLAWSPQGSYLCSFDPLGVSMWGGETLSSMGGFGHREVPNVATGEAIVDTVSFSPNEKYAVTFRHRQLPPLQQDPDLPAMCVWGVDDKALKKKFMLKFNVENRCMVKLFEKSATDRSIVNKTFTGKVEFSSDLEERKDVSPADERIFVTIDCGGNDRYTVRYRDLACSLGQDFTATVGASKAERVISVQPLQQVNSLKWSMDGRMLGRVGGDVISVYEAPAMNLLDKRSLVAPGVVDFEWSPTDNVMIYWALGLGNAPSRVSLVRMPEREEISRRNLFFGVLDGRISWQDQGDYCSVTLTKQIRKGVVGTHIYVFRMRDPLIPIEQIELEEPARSVTWEPSGNRLAIVVSKGQWNQKVIFYSMEHNGKKEMTQLASVPADSDVNHCAKIDRVLWSPMGGVCVLAHNVAGASSENQFDFYDVDAKAYLHKEARKHLYGTELQWDPSGRFLLSIATSQDKAYKTEREFGWMLFTFQGEPIAKARHESLLQLAWRPRPRILSKQQRDEVAKNLKSYRLQFDKEDRQKKIAMQRSQDKVRRRAAREFTRMIAPLKSRYASVEDRINQLRGDMDSNMYYEEKEMVETVISVREEVLQD